MGFWNTFVNGTAILSMIPYLNTYFGTKSNTTLPSSQTGDVIVQLFEWSWKDIAEECRTFLPQHGYTAVQTSPVTEHLVLTDSWRERYQPISYKIMNEEDFRNMVKVCKQNNIKVYVDVILNHMSKGRDLELGSGRISAGTKARNYPDVPYTPSDFHQSCMIDDWNDPWQVRNCELEGRDDLNQTTENVRDKIAEFLNKLIDIGVAGFRVSDAKHIDVQDLAEIYSRVKDLNTTYFPANSRPYIYHEVSANPPMLSFQRHEKEPGKKEIQPSEYLELGAVEDHQFSYALYVAFKGNIPPSSLNTSEGLLNLNKSVVFVDTITKRGWRRDNSPTYKDKKRYKMALGFMLAWPHLVSRVMSSLKFTSTYEDVPSGPVNCSSDDWICEHRWPEIYNMIHFRKTVFGSEVSDWWASNSNNQVAFCRKGKGFVAINVDERIALNKTLQTRLPSGTYCDVISGSKTDKNSCSGKNVTVGADGQADIQIKHDEKDRILAIHVGSKIG